MSVKAKSRSREHASVRQVVTLPATRAIEVRRVAKERHLMTSRALVELAQRGVEAEAQSRAGLNTTYLRFMSEPDSARKEESGKELIRSIFGTDAIAEDSIR